MPTILGVTRKQLGSFLTDQDLIRQFERLFEIVASIDSTTPGEVSVDDNVSEADRKSVEALDRVQSISDAVYFSRLEKSISSLFDEIYEIKKEIDSIKSIPQQKESLLALASDFKSKSTSPVDNDVMCFDSTLNKWTPRTFKGTTGRLFDSSVNLNNASGALLGTLANSPVAGNPAKWITIDDNGTLRKIPTW